MISRFSVFICVVFIVSLAAVNVMGSDTPGQREGKVFSNDDLESYRNPSDNKALAQNTEKKEDKRDGLKKLQEEIDREKWCKRATALRKKIEKAQDEVKDLEEKLSEEKKSDLQWDNKKSKARERKLRSEEKKIEKAGKKLKYAEKDLADLEDDAHRKGVLPGWLRCQ